jgi:hypothetical protein
MRANPVVMAPPALDNDLSLAQRVEDLAVEELVTQARMAARSSPLARRTCPAHRGAELFDDRAGHGDTHQKFFHFHHASPGRGNMREYLR